MFEIDPAHDALIIVDVQNDFCPGGTLAVAEGDRVVAVLNRYARLFAERGAPIFASRDWHPPRTRHFREFGGAWPPHCVQGSEGARFHPDLQLPTGTEVISKGSRADEDAYSCFQGRTEGDVPFADVLTSLGIRRLFVGGLATDYCVRATVLDARASGFDVIVLEDAVRAVDVKEGDGLRALDEMKTAGAVAGRLP